MATSVERAALNEVRFREANEQIERRRAELGFDGRTPYLCECEDASCVEVITLTPEEYRDARANARCFLLVDGHPFREGDIVAGGDGYVVVEKDGESGRIAERETP